jgi:tetratricopeptide (TPR) repeat protein
MASAVVCPACHTRNKPTWAYCARCNEPLEGVLPETVADVPSAARPSAERDFSSLYLLLIIAIVVVGSALACRDIASRPPEPAPTPGVFTFGGGAAPTPAPAGAPAAGKPADAGRRLLAQGKAADAIPLLEAAAAEDTESAELRQLLGRARWDSGDREGALASYAEAARLDPAGYRLGYAQSLEMAGRLDEATAEFEATVAAQPDSAIAREGLGRAYYRRGEYAKALPLLETLAAQTRDPVVLQQLAFAAERAGDRDRAIATYREVLAVEPGAEVARANLADSLVAAGRPADAVGVLQEGLQRTPQAPLLQRGLGSALEQAGRNAEAAAAYRAYARLAPNAPDAKELLARAARLEGSAGGSGS